MWKLASTMSKVGCRKRKLKAGTNAKCWMRKKMQWFVHSTELEDRIRKLDCCLWKVECRKRKLECCINQSWTLNAKSGIANLNSNDKHKMHDRLCKVQCKMEHWILAEMERHSNLPEPVDYNAPDTLCTRYVILKYVKNICKHFTLFFINENTATPISMWSKKKLLNRWTPAGLEGVARECCSFLRGTCEKIERDFPP